MLRFISIGMVVFTLAAVLIGCSQQSGKDQAPGEDGSKYLLKSEPAGAKGVIEVRKESKDKDEVVVVGRVGGDVDPWVEGLAAFSIADRKVKACNEIEGDTCPTPWDFCCEIDLPKKTALIQIVDEKGDIVERGAKKLLNLKELDTVIVRGTAKRDKKGNLTIVAKGVYVKKKFPW